MTEDAKDNVVTLRVGDKVMLRKNYYPWSRNNPTDIVGEVIRVGLGVHALTVVVKWSGENYSNIYKHSDLILQPPNIPKGYEYRGEIRVPKEGDEFLTGTRSEAPRGYNTLMCYKGYIKGGGVRFIVHKIDDKQKSNDYPSQVNPKVKAYVDNNIMYFKNSKETQEYLFSLGYSWSDDVRTAQYLTAKFVCLGRDRITCQLTFNDSISSARRPTKLNDFKETIKQLLATSNENKHIKDAVLLRGGLWFNNTDKSTEIVIPEIAISEIAVNGVIVKRPLQPIDFEDTINTNDSTQPKEKTTMKQSRILPSTATGNFLVIKGYEASKLTKEDAFELLQEVEATIKTLNEGVGSNTKYIKDKIEAEKLAQKELINILNDKLMTSQN